MYMGRQIGGLSLHIAVRAKQEQNKNNSLHNLEMMESGLYGKFIL